MQCILDKPNETTTIYKELLPNVKKYSEIRFDLHFYAVATLINAIVTNTQDYISLSGEIDIAISDRSVILHWEIFKRKILLETLF